MSQSIKIEVSHRFQASAERVYDAWLDPEKVRLWLPAALRRMGLSGEMGRVEIDARVGGSFLFADLRDGVEAKHWGTYLRLDRPRLIEFTWITDASEDSEPGRVTLTITPDGDGCVANLVHQLDAKWADYFEQTCNGWNCFLQAVDELLI